MELNNTIQGAFALGITGNVYDQYTPIIGGDAFDLNHGLPRWLPAHHRRRIKAYDYLNKMMMNQDLPLSVQSDMNPIRFGIVAYALEVLRDLTVGSEQKIVVAGAAEEDAATPLVIQQKLMNEWATRNMFFPKMQKFELHAGLFGDGFLRLRMGMRRGKKDVKVDVIDPAFVFPQWNKDDDIIQVTLIWEEYTPVNGIDVLSVYKDVYVIGPNGNIHETAGWYQYTAVPSLDDLQIQVYDTLDDGTPIKDLDLNIKQMPVYHLPNFWTEYNYGISDLCYNVNQVQETNASDTDMSAASRLLGIPPLVLAGLINRVKGGDTQNTSDEQIGPGKILHINATGGKAEYLDNTGLLDCLTKYADRVESKFFRNMRLGKLFAGETDNIRDIESQKAFKTLMATLYARIAQKRTVRDAFYADFLIGLREMLILTAQASDYPQDQLTLRLGNILPQDNSDDLALIGTVWQQGKGPLSALTAAKLAAAAGSGVVDFNKEAEAILAQLALGGKGQPGSDPAAPPPKKSFSLKPKQPQAK